MKRQQSKRMRELRHTANRENNTLKRAWARIRSNLKGVTS